MWIETQDLIIGVRYKPPSLSNCEFLDKFEETLHTIYLSNKKRLIMGDNNINTLMPTNISKEYVNLIFSEGFNPFILDATHVTDSSQTCIDHIYANFSLPSTSGSIAIEIADHLHVFSIFYNMEYTPFPDSLEFKDFKKCKSGLFKMTLNEVDWFAVYSSSDVNESLPRFLRIFNRISNKHAPLKSVKVKSTSSKPWITSGLKKSMKVRDKLYLKKWPSTHNLLFLNKYKLTSIKIFL